MPDRQRLTKLLASIDGRSYTAYRDLKGPWQVDDVTLMVDHVQGDPFASPSRIRVLTQTGLAGLDDQDAREATEDWLLRRLGRSIQTTRRGSGKSGLITIYRPGPEILRRSALRLSSDGQIDIRLGVGLPARGRRVLGRQAQALLLDDLMDIAARTTAEELDDADREELASWVRSVKHQRSLRRALREKGLVAFIADASILPRASGVAQRPMKDAVPFASPQAYRVTIDTPEGSSTGMGIPHGVTLIVGGGFHGKSTVLDAIQRGHLDHIPGDGREQVVADADTVKIRAEDGRRVHKVNISAFLDDLPGGRSTRPFSTDDASGSTSQAAAIVEAVEAGAKLLLLDEDTSATNLLVRDERMRMLIARDREPITPLVERVREIAQVWKVSVILVIGGVGDFLSVADHVIAMDAFRCRDVTERAHEIAGEPPESPTPLPMTDARVVLRDGLAPGKIRARDDRAVQYGRGEIILTAVEQVLDSAHAYSIGQALRFLHDELVDEKRTVRQLLQALDAILADEGVEALSPRGYPDGGLVHPRRHEIAAALNRLRSLQTTHDG